PTRRSSDLSFIRRLTLLLFLPFADCQLTRALSGASTGSNRGCSVMSSATRPCSRTDDYASPGAAGHARSAQSHAAADYHSATAAAAAADMSLTRAPSAR